MSVPTPTRLAVDHDPRVEHWDAMREVSPALFSDAALPYDAGGM